MDRDEREPAQHLFQYRTRGEVRRADQERDDRGAEEKAHAEPDVKGAKARREDIRFLLSTVVEETEHRGRRAAAPSQEKADRAEPARLAGDDNRPHQLLFSVTAVAITEKNSSRLWGPHSDATESLTSTTCPRRTASSVEKPGRFAKLAAL